MHGHGSALPAYDAVCLRWHDTWTNDTGTTPAGSDIEQHRTKTHQAHDLILAHLVTLMVYKSKGKDLLALELLLCGLRGQAGIGGGGGLRRRRWRGRGVGWGRTDAPQLLGLLRCVGRARQRGQRIGGWWCYNYT